MLDGDGVTWRYTCQNVGCNGREWTATTRAAANREGEMAQLGLYDDLLACFDSNEHLWVEHGVVEHRFLLRSPATYFEVLLPRYGHTSLGPAKSMSTSLRIAMALSQLRHEGLLEYRTWKPTGFWAKNSTISYWAKPPAPPDDSRLTWAAYAESNGFDPRVWDFHSPPSGAS